ncbi:hypothetical protein GWI33_001886 [Rhynchophorus ferrugineus]|uniref:Uncharacterized protein n=1 Tax=Rhynchophorus ferrugineus TaxID=354439 RepID=A0A834MHV8_RHYFE|nr:hypothetical protein GWI33_001886 [Rhynchophorus ferrugineus]
MRLVSEQCDRFRSGVIGPSSSRTVGVRAPSGRSRRRAGGNARNSNVTNGKRPKFHSLYSTVPKLASIEFVKF